MQDLSSAIEVLCNDRLVRQLLQVRMHALQRFKLRPPRTRLPHPRRTPHNGSRCAGNSRVIFRKDGGRDMLAQDSLDASISAADVKAAVDAVADVSSRLCTFERIAAPRIDRLLALDLALALWAGFAFVRALPSPCDLLHSAWARMCVCVCVCLTHSPRLCRGRRP